jgi:hypothetical protein
MERDKRIQIYGPEINEKFEKAGRSVEIVKENHKHYIKEIGRKVMPSHQLVYQAFTQYNDEVSPLLPNYGFYIDASAGKNPQSNEIKNFPIDRTKIYYLPDSHDGLLHYPFSKEEKPDDLNFIGFDNYINNHPDHSFKIIYQDRLDPDSNPKKDAPALPNYQQLLFLLNYLEQSAPDLINNPDIQERKNNLLNAVSAVEKQVLLMKQELAPNLKSRISQLKDDLKDLKINKYLPFRLKIAKNTYYLQNSDRLVKGYPLAGFGPLKIERELGDAEWFDKSSDIADEHFLNVVGHIDRG